MLEYITKEKIDAYKKQADAYNAFLDFQNRQVNIIAKYVENGGTLNTKLSDAVDKFHKKGLRELERYIVEQRKRIELLER